MCLALNATGSVLLHLQWDGRTEQRKFGLSVLTSSPAWSAKTSTTFLVSGLDLRGPGVAMAPLLSPILLQGKDVEGGVNRLVVGGSTGICITTAWVSATWLGRIKGAGLFWLKTFFCRGGGLFSSRRGWSQESSVWAHRRKRTNRVKRPRYFNRNNKLWRLRAVSPSQDASARTSVSLFFPQKRTESPKCLTAQNVLYRHSYLSHTWWAVSAACLQYINTTNYSHSEKTQWIP